MAMNLYYELAIRTYYTKAKMSKLQCVFLFCRYAIGIWYRVQDIYYRLSIYHDYIWYDSADSTVSMKNTSGQIYTQKRRPIPRPHRRENGQSSMSYTNKMTAIYWERTVVRLATCKGSVSPPLASFTLELKIMIPNIAWWWPDGEIFCTIFFFRKSHPVCIFFDVHCNV